MRNPIGQDYLLDPEGVADLCGVGYRKACAMIRETGRYREVSRGKALVPMVLESVLLEYFRSGQPRPVPVVRPAGERRSNLKTGAAPVSFRELAKQMSTT